MRLTPRLHASVLSSSFLSFVYAPLVVLLRTSRLLKFAHDLLLIILQKSYRDMSTKPFVGVARSLELVHQTKNCYQITVIRRAWLHDALYSLEKFFWASSQLLAVHLWHAIKTIFVEVYNIVVMTFCRVQHKQYENNLLFLNWTSW